MKKKQFNEELNGELNSETEILFQKISDKYVPERKIGRGSRACVYLVRNINTDEYLAMKLYAENYQEANRELEILKNMKGHGIPYLYDCFRWEKYTCIFMEYIEGQNLREILIQKHILCEDYVYEITEQILMILERFHQHTSTYIYGDLKPENIMITDKNKIYLIDFGSVLSCHEKKKQMMGTKEYSPEGVQSLTPFRDVYALGVILYELLTGYSYYEGIENGKADISYLSEGFRNLLHKATRLNPAENFFDGKEMKQALIQTKKGDFSLEKKSKGKKNYFVGDTKRFFVHGCRSYLFAGVSLVLTAFLSMVTENKSFENNDNLAMKEGTVITTTTVLCEEIGNHYSNKTMEIKTLSQNDFFFEKSEE